MIVKIRDLKEIYNTVILLTDITDEQVAINKFNNRIPYAKV